jgi:hypothetical protein
VALEHYAARPVHDAAPAPAHPANPAAFDHVPRDEVVPGLFVGSYHPANDAALLKRNGIVHVCCCIGDAPRHSGDFTYAVLEADDAAGHDISQHFDETYAFIDHEGAPTITANPNLGFADQLKQFAVKQLAMSPSQRRVSSAAYDAQDPLVREHVHARR